ncbi:MAG: hypothetical protein PHF57_13165 [Methanoregula sp.]|nr:hypothetical protein [Methanoregula sp.]
MDKGRDIEEDLKPSTGDYINTGIKAGLSTAPYIGGPIAEFFSFVIAPPLEKRRTEWLIEIYKRLQLLEKSSEEFKPENLAKNEKFFSVFLQATQIAMRTHQKEKIDALQNAVINSVSMPTIDENLQLIFLNLVDRYTPWHLTILQFLDSPRQYGESRGKKYPSWSSGGTSSVLEFTFPDLQNRREFYDQIVKELYSNGLLNSDTFLHTTMTDQGMFASRTTEMGKKFLAFITFKTE